MQCVPAGDLGSGYPMNCVDGFVSLTDPRFECKEYVYYLPANVDLSQKILYVNGCFERTVYRIANSAGGSISTRVYNKGD
ncbi:hypothetical protein [Bat adenovirus 2]|uniref:Uncharacterized protein n=1 Tax=Bat adenovirus 2 TaxID=696069 RepID=G1FQN8_9ADEN|nr:hypothetical protein BatAdV2_gp25 [Bat adenovirus 2]AEM06285.1 hypothetical protein [Bat adenovirus 2]QDA77096.1 ORF6/7 [Bat mastadenovirus B]